MPDEAPIDSAPVERDYLSVDDLSPEEFTEVLDLAADIKAKPDAYAAR